MSTFINVWIRNIMNVIFCFLCEPNDDRHLDAVRTSVKYCSFESILQYNYVGPWLYWLNYNQLAYSINWLL